MSNREKTIGMKQSGNMRILQRGNSNGRSEFLNMCDENSTTCRKRKICTRKTSSLKIILKIWWNKTRARYSCCYCCCSVTKLYLTLCTHRLQHTRLLCPPLSLGVCSNSCSLSRRCYLTFSFSAAPFLLPSTFPSIRVFSNESSLPIKWLKYWSFSISPSNEYSGLISFRVDWFDLPAVQNTLKSLLQHNSKASSLWHSAGFIAQLSYPYMTTKKNNSFN